MLYHNRILILIYLDVLKLEFHVLILNIFCLNNSKWDALPLTSSYTFFSIEFI